MIVAIDNFIGEILMISKAPKGMQRNKSTVIKTVISFIYKTAFSEKMKKSFKLSLH